MSFQKVSGTFKNVASTPYFQPIVGKVNKFYLKNLTVSGIDALGVSGSLASDRISEAWYYPDFMTSDTASVYQNGTVGSGLAPISLGVLSLNALSLFDASDVQKGPNIVVNSFTPGTTTVWVTNTAHGFKVGDNVRVGNLTSAPELGGLIMTVTAVGSTTQFTTLLDSTNSVTSVGTVYKFGSAYLPPLSLYYPEYRVMAKITQANPMVVTTLVRQNYQVGDVVRFQIPTDYGMQQLNTPNTGIPFEATVSAVNNAVGTQTITFANVDSSAFDAFAFPGTGYYPISFPTVIPQGEGNLNSLIGITPSPLPYANQNILGFATQNQGARGVLIGAGDGTNDSSTGGLISSNVDAWYWEAETFSQTYY